MEVCSGLSTLVEARELLQQFEEQDREIYVLLWYDQLYTSEKWALLPLRSLSLDDKQLQQLAEDIRDIVVWNPYGA
ncbi:MAG: hypothetical protein ACOY3P_26825 [Planctomycetota bacterium]